MAKEKTAKNYPVTTRFGWVKGYPLHTSPSDPAIPLYYQKRYPGKGYGFHTGVDRAMPIGTPIKINNTIVALSGNTGASTGPHEHIGKYGLSGKLINPGNSGYDMFSVPLMRPVVIGRGEDSLNGKWLRIRATSGRTYVHLHLSKQIAKTGDKIK